MVNVFVSHSSRDVDLIDPLNNYLKKNNVKPELLEFNIEGRAPLSKIEKHMTDSAACLLVWSKNVDSRQTTRDIINAEIACAHSKNLPIYAFIEKDTSPPWFLQEITDYTQFEKKEFSSKLSLIQGDINRLKNDENIKKALIVGTISIIAVVSIIAITIILYKLLNDSKNSNQGKLQR